MKPRLKKQPSTTKTSDVPNTTIKTLPPPLTNPPQVFVLPKDLLEGARILTLPHPATGTPIRFLLCPLEGCYEFTRIAGEKREKRSWLLAPHRSDDATGGYDEGHVLEKPDLMLATPIDPLFLILPALLQGGKEMYLSLSDYLDKLEAESEHMRLMMRNERFELLFERRIGDVCDFVDAGEERLYRLSRNKLTEVLVQKASKMVSNGLPASMEERFVKQALAVPVLNVKREESSVSLAKSEDDVDATDGAAESQSEAASSVGTSQDSQTTTTSISTTATSVFPTADTEPAETITHLLRLRTALTFLISSYLRPTLQNHITTALADSTTSPIDFKPLDTHLTHLASLRKEAQALRSLSDNISRKRGHMDENDDEALEKAEAKKRKKEEKDIRKKNVSRGVKKLEKVDRSGMKNLSSFFTAKAKS